MRKQLIKYISSDLLPYVSKGRNTWPHPRPPKACSIPSCSGIVNPGPGYDLTLCLPHLRDHRNRLQLAHAHRRLRIKRALRLREWLLKRQAVHSPISRSHFEEATPPPLTPVQQSLASRLLSDYLTRHPARSKQAYAAAVRLTNMWARAGGDSNHFFWHVISPAMNRNRCLRKALLEGNYDPEVFATGIVPPPTDLSLTNGRNRS